MVGGDHDDCPPKDGASWRACCMYAGRDGGWPWALSTVRPRCDLRMISGPAGGRWRVVPPSIARIGEAHVHR